MTDAPEVGRRRRAPLRKLAILFGLATDLAGTMISLWGVMVAAVVIATIQSGGNNPRNLMSGWATDSAYVLTLMIIGIVWSVGGGFVARLRASTFALRATADKSR